MRGFIYRSGPLSHPVSVGAHCVENDDDVHMILSVACDVRNVQSRRTGDTFQFCAVLLLAVVREYEHITQCWDSVTNTLK